MSWSELSIIMKCWYDFQTHTTHVQLVRTDTTEEVLLKNSTFLLRISREEGTSIERCYIRHIASGREAYLQGGPNLRLFVKACLLNSGSLVTDDPGEQKDNEAAR